MPPEGNSDQDPHIGHAISRFTFAEGLFSLSLKFGPSRLSSFESTPSFEDSVEYGYNYDTDKNIYHLMI